MDLVECPTSRRLFVDKHTLMISSTPQGRVASAVALRELDLHLSVRNAKNVVKLEKHLLQGERLHLLYEYCGCGDLLDIMQQEIRRQSAGLPPQKLQVSTTTDAGKRRIFTAVLRGVQALHSAGIVHLDLSPENVFVTEAGVVKVGDLGHAQRFKNDRSVRVEQVAKEVYAAPELLVHPDVQDVRQADAWSLGIILWTMCTKRPLLRRASIGDAMFQRMVKCGTAVALQETGLLSQMPASLVDLLAGLLDVDHESRLSVEAALQHPWVKQVSPESLKTPQLSRRKSFSNAFKKKSEELMKKHRSSEKKGRVRTASAEIALESTRVTLTSRSAA